MLFKGLTSLTLKTIVLHKRVVLVMVCSLSVRKLGWVPVSIGCIPFRKNKGLFLALVGTEGLAGNERGTSGSHSPTRSAFRESQMLQLKSSYPASKRRPLREKATDVIPQMMLS